jgi:23S rRNA (cytosine1962-C5)-methyltransferase
LQAFGRQKGRLEQGEMLLKGAEQVLPVPSGGFCWCLAD